jgi:RNA polymerase sigma-70 factor (ECF subfamily)
MQRRPAERTTSFHQFDWDSIRLGCEAEARRWLSDEHDAQDAAQEALVRAWRHWSSRWGDAPEAWVRTIARRAALRVGGRRGRERASPHAQPLAVEAPPEPDDGELPILVAQALSELPAPDRLLLRLRYERDLTQRQIAELLGMPEGTVKVRLHRLRNRVRTRLS